jgi:hypothetical protein
VALLAVLAVLLGGAAWLYVKHGDSLMGVSPFHGSTSTTSSSGKPRVGSDAPAGTEVSFAGRAAPIELPCALRHEDIQRVLRYLTLKGRWTHRDLVSVCKYYGTTVSAATS